MSTKPKRRSDISKLVSRARDIWRQSENYQAIKRRCKIPGKSGWFMCEKCGHEVEVLRVDHIESIGCQPDWMQGFGTWLPLLFCSTDNLQGLCNACHKVKTKIDRMRK